MIKTSKNIMKWVCLLYILPIHLNHHVTMVLLWHANMWFYIVVHWSWTNRPWIFRFGSCFPWIGPSKGLFAWTYELACTMTDITCITSFLNIPSYIYLLYLTIYSTYFTWLSYSNDRYLREKAFSYVIGLLEILFKQLAPVFQRKESEPNSKYPSSYTPTTDDSLFSQYIYSALASSPPFTTKSSFDLLLVPHYLQKLCMCPATMSYRILIPWG